MLLQLCFSSLFQVRLETAAGDFGCRAQHALSAMPVFPWWPPLQRMCSGAARCGDHQGCAEEQMLMSRVAAEVLQYCTGQSLLVMDILDQILTSTANTLLSP